MRVGARRHDDDRDVAVGGVQRGAVTVEGLPEALGVEGGIAETFDQGADDLGLEFDRQLGPTVFFRIRFAMVSSPITWA